jgi:hypothetical protein
MAVRQDVRQKLHAAHQGINGTKRRAHQTVYSPGINNDIQSDCESYIPCQRAAASLPQEPMKSDPPPSRIFEEVSADLFSHGGHHPGIRRPSLGMDHGDSMAKGPDVA